MKTKVIILFFSLSFFASCSKLSYMVEQAKGQFSILYQGRNNQDVLNDANISEEVKRKIRLVQKAKKYFYQYFNRPETKIYNKTTMLNREAVTYLVIVSPKNRIEPVSTSFPFVGSFPYLGFFSKKSAQYYVQKMKKKNMSTYMRNVYAYSTLGHFNDRILSSFFQYSDNDLIEMIFHELIHTIFFIRNEVSFNENMANFLGEKLLDTYLGKKRKRIDYSPLSKTIVAQTKKLNEIYKQTNKEEREVLSRELPLFFKRIKATCKEFYITNCWPLRVGKWNNARFAAYMTYNEGRKVFEELYVQEGESPKKLLKRLEKGYSSYKKQSKTKEFYQYLKEQEELKDMR